MSAFAAGAVKFVLVRWIKKLIKRRLRKRLMKKLLEELAKELAKRRTSTKSGAVGLLPGLLPLVAMVPFYEQINALFVQACQAEDGPVLFFLGWALTWGVMYVSARRSKTPENPGVL